MRIILLIVLLTLCLEAMAFDSPYIMRSPQGLLMGDAFTGLASDEFSMFYNSASLARPGSDFKLTPINPQLSGTNILSNLDKFKDFPDDPVGASKLLMNEPLHASAGFAPGFKMFNVGVTFIANESYDALLRNRSHPMLDLDVHSDRGLMMGVGIPLSQSRLSRKTGTGVQTSLGITGKYIERSGVNDSIALTGPVFLDSLGKDKVDDIIKGLGKVKGHGYGFDTSLEHIIRGGGAQFVMALSALDVGGTKFNVPNNPDKLKVSDIRSQFNFGIAASQDVKVFNYSLSLDVRGLNEQMDSGKRLRIGGSFGIPGMKVMAGMNSGYMSYGAMLDFYFMKLMAGFYDVELGSTYQQIQGKRFILYLSLFDFTFDA